MPNEYFEETVDVDAFRKQREAGATTVEPDNDTDLEIQIQDDRAPDDRNKPLAHEMRTPIPDDNLTPPPADAPEDEREKYARDAQARIKQATAHAHAERRSREEAERQAEAAMGLAKSYMEQIKELQNQYKGNEDFAIKAIKQESQALIDALSDQLVKAQMEQDAEKSVKIQRALNEAQGRLMQLNGFRPANLRAPDPERDIADVATRLPQRQTPQKVDDATLEWASRNPWFDTQPKMRALALALDGELQAQNVNPLTDAATYYTTIDKEMRQRFPDYPWQNSANRTAAAPPVVTAGATRSSTPRKKGTITLTRSEAEAARKLGIPLEAYAREVAKLRKGE